MCTVILNSYSTNYVRAILPEAQSPVCGFRYFNVYGPREGHKGSMASVAFHLNNQILKVKIQNYLLAVNTSVVISFM